MSDHTSKIKVGGHVSMSGGLDKAVERAAKIGGSCMQIFSGSPRMWRRRDLENFDFDKMFSKQEEFDVSPVFIHALYLINLASDDPELITKSVRSLIYDLRFDSLAKSSGVVVHLGSHQGRGWGSVKAQLVKHIHQILEESPENSQLLIENSAGQSGKIGSDLDDIKWLLDHVDSQRLGWCVDTCHAFAAGYVLDENSKFMDKKGSLGNLIDKIKALDLAETLKCVHVNDSKTKFASGNDRHENIGEGEIPQTSLKAFLNHSLIKSKPLITEVPGLDGDGPDLENVNRIKKLLKTS